jgi:hypothetical protein
MRVQESEQGIHPRAARHSYTVTFFFLRRVVLHFFIISEEKKEGRNYEDDHHQRKELFINMVFLVWLLCAMPLDRCRGMLVFPG